MANQASGAEDPVGAEPLPGLRDAQMLKEAMHEATSTSPEAFLMTIDEHQGQGNRLLGKGDQLFYLGGHSKRR